MITVLVVTNSLCGFMANQVRYNLGSYYIIIIIFIIN